MRKKSKGLRQGYSSLGLKSDVKMMGQKRQALECELEDIRSSKKLQLGNYKEEQLYSM